MHREDNRGLRFHVREQVHLPDDAPEIEAIRELELEPVVEVTASGGSVTVSGFLSLTGKYIGRREYLGGIGDGREAHVPFPFHPLESERGPLAPWQKRGEIRHRIPLDITVPEERVPDLEDVFVVIDSFDYEVNGPRSLRIDAVLEVTGIVVENRRDAQTVEPGAPAAPVLVRGTESVPPARDANVTTETAAEGVAEPVPVLRGDDAREASRGDMESSASDGNEAALARVLPSAQEPSAPEAGYGDETAERSASEAVEAAAAPAEADDISARQGSDAAEEVQPQPEPQADVKVAITAKAKPEESSVRPLSSYLMEKLTSRASAEPYPADGEDQAEGKAAAAREGQGADAESGETAKRPENGGYLVGLLKEKEERYTRLTMCIVQRDDTLASIAERYGVSASAIRSVNRMTDDRVEVGQILLIPRGEG